MSKDILDILKHTNFFKDISTVKNIINISSNKYKILLDDKSYVFSLLALDDYANIEIEAYVNSILEEAGLNPLKIYDKGLLPDIEKSYKIYEFRDEIALKDFLESSDQKNQEVLGRKLAIALKNLHSVGPDKKVDWQNEFLVETNHILYKHGLNEIADDDYILTDFIQANRYLTENTSLNLLYKHISDKNIRVYDNDKIDLRGIKNIEFGDGIRDFVEINRIAINYPSFSKAVLTSYFDNKKPSRKFYRLLSLYQATIILASIIDIRNGDESYLSLYEINSIMDMYDHFNSIIPAWAD